MSSQRRQAIPAQQKYTIRAFNADFPTDSACLEFLFQQRWPGGIAFCHKCKGDRKHHPIKGRTAYCCQVCGEHIFPLAGTIFHKSSTSLKTWFYVIKMMTSTRCGVSAKHIQRETGVTYKTAWRMMTKIRTLMNDNMKLSGPVEMDEAYFGGAEENKHRQLIRQGKKTVVLGVVERKGKVIARVVPDAKKTSIMPVVAEVLHPKTMIYTDDAAVFDGLRWMGQSHKHSVVNKTLGYKQGYAHTNSVEGFWSLVKRGIQGVYYKVGEKYLQSYLNEYAFRYNRRKVLRPMFTQLLERTSTQVLPCVYEQKLLASQSSCKPF